MAGFFLRLKRLLRSSFLSSSSCWWCAFFCNLFESGIRVTEHGGVHAFICSAMTFLVQSMVNIHRNGMCSPNCSASQQSSGKIN
jgi:hypothetical protein